VLLKVDIADNNRSIEEAVKKTKDKIATGDKQAIKHRKDIEKSEAEDQK
jgi:hypothetical protein